jgi:calcium/calmodulin-dependent protein kinase (CaM kinase) II
LAKTGVPQQFFHKAMPTDLTQELVNLNQKLLVAIVNGDWRAYEALCDPSITCFEPEARGQLAVGMLFHRYYFDLPGSPQKPAKNVTMSQPHVRLMGDAAAVVSYVRLTQSLDSAGQPQTSRVEETRVWQKIDGEWKHVHFHRSANA